MASSTVIGKLSDRELNANSCAPARRSATSPRCPRNSTRSCNDRSDANRRAAASSGTVADELQPKVEIEKLGAARTAAFSGLWVLRNARQRQ